MKLYVCMTLVVGAFNALCQLVFYLSSNVLYLKIYIRLGPFRDVNIFMVVAIGGMRLWVVTTH